MDKQGESGDRRHTQGQTEMVAWVEDTASAPGVTQGCMSRRPGKNQFQIDQTRNSTTMREKKLGHASDPSTARPFSGGI